MKNGYWVGLDLGERRTSICVLDEAGEPLLEQECATAPEEIEAVLAPFSRPAIRLLATEAGSCTHIARSLRARGYPVAIFDARKARKFLAIRSNKSDAGDARGLADVARLGRNTVSQVYLRSVECQQLRSRLVMRRKLTHMRTAAENMVRTSLALYGRPFTPPRNLVPFKQLVQVELALLKDEQGIDLHDELSPLIDACENFRAWLKRMDKELAVIARSHPVCRLLMEVPGVGPICALSFFTAVEDPARFKRNADVAAYLGLVPRRYQSGDTCRTFGITKTGSKLTRMHLVTSALAFRRFAPDSALKEWALALKERIGSARSKVALARKLSIVMLAMWKTGSHFEPRPARQKAIRTFD